MAGGLIGRGAAQLRAIVARLRAPRLRSGERPLRAFVSSVMTPELDWARQAAVQTLDGVEFLTAWAFEFTPASSEPADEGYLRHVREADFVIWLAGAQTSQPVVHEINEALAAQRRLIVLLLPADQRAPETEALIARVRPLAKYRELQAATAAQLRLELNLAFGDEVVRALRGLPGLGRLARLEELGRSSRARTIERWLAAGTDPALAQVLADDITVGQPRDDVIPNDGRRVVVLSAEVGAGKSLAGERLHQTTVATYLEDASAPVPVWLRGRDVAGTNLMGAVTERCTWLGDPRRQGAAIVVDGIDETGPSVAAELVGAARVLTGSWPATAAVLTTRPLPGVAHADERATIERLSENESHDLIGRVADRPITIGYAASRPASLREAVGLPLFAIFFGALLRDGDLTAPTSRGALLAMLAQRAQDRVDSNVEEGLRRLARLSLQRAGGAVPTSEVCAPTDVGRLVATRLVVEESGTVSFPLVVFTQWFAAVSLANGEPTVQSLTHSEGIDDWLYPLAILCATYPHDTVAPILGPIARTLPGFASRVVDEALAHWSITDVPAPPALIAAERVRDATAAWVAGIGPLAELVAPQRADGQLASLGSATDGAGLTLVCIADRRTELTSSNSRRTSAPSNYAPGGGLASSRDQGINQHGRGAGRMRSCPRVSWRCSEPGACR